MVRFALLPSSLLLVACATEPPSRLEPFAEGAFERLDTDRNGVVDAREMEDARAGQFARADLDGDGFLTERELAGVRGGDMRGARRGGARGPDPVARMDRDGDGRVSQAEFRGTTALLKRADFDGDGEVTRGEFEEAAERVAARAGRRR